MVPYGGHAGDALRFTQHAQGVVPEELCPERLELSTTYPWNLTGVRPGLPDVLLAANLAAR